MAGRFRYFDLLQNKHNDLIVEPSRRCAKIESWMLHSGLQHKYVILIRGLARLRCPFVKVQLSHGILSLNVFDVFLLGLLLRST